MVPFLVQVIKKRLTVRPNTASEIKDWSLLAFLRNCCVLVSFSVIVNFTKFKKNVTELGFKSLDTRYYIKMAM